MKNLLYILLAVFAFTFTACEDEELYPVPDWDTGVHGFGRIKSGGNASFSKNDDSKQSVPIVYHWNSIDGFNTVTKAEFFITFTESYKDLEKNSRVANHGTKKLRTVEGSALPANRVDLEFSVSSKEVFELFKDAKFDYYKDGNVVSVFSNPIKPTRTEQFRFITDDSFSLTWILYTADGRVFDTWSSYVCGELVGANCNVAWAVK